MANQKASSKKILQNRVNGVVNAFDGFKVSLKNNRDKISDEDFKSMILFLENKCEKDIVELQEIYAEQDETFSFD